MTTTDKVIQDLLLRETIGISKYGVTPDKANLTHRQWLQHAYEEALDMAIYLKQAMSKEYYAQNGNFNKPLLPAVLTYGLLFDKSKMEWITIEATNYNEENSPIAWAVRQGRTCMSKFSGRFDYEPSPSSRDNDFFNEYRFNTPEEAARRWNETIQEK